MSLLCKYQNNGHFCTIAVFISDNTDRDTIAVHLFQKILIAFLTSIF